MFVPVPSQLGYAAVGALVLGESAGVPLPGETAPITAGGLVAAGHLSLPPVVLVTGLAAIAGDTVGHWLGRPGARALLLRDGIGAAHRHHAVARANRFFALYGLATAFAGRWVPGVRIVAAATAGASARAVTIATLAARG